MPRRRPKGIKALNEFNPPANVLQTNRATNPEYQKSLKGHGNLQLQYENPASPIGVIGVRSLFDADENHQPGPSTSTSLGTASLYDELDSFRQRWKRELEQTKLPEGSERKDGKETRNANDTQQSDTPEINKSCSIQINKDEDEKDTYSKAKELFLLAVKLEQDELHHESIRYYKQAMHLCPDIERRIFKEQCEANALINAKNDKDIEPQKAETIENKPSDNIDSLSLYTRVRQNLDADNSGYGLCKPATKLKQGCLHISDLPRELILLVFRYIIGQELDLSSLEAAGLVCRGFYLLSRDQSLWRSICCSVWEDNNDVGLSSYNGYMTGDQKTEKTKQPIDWRDTFMKKPRVNYDGVYISRTRYIRQGDVGFQDLTYRPFHVVRYYRYLRFLPEHRVLILTTNEEPEKIVPIFRHATQAKQFSSELSILDGTYEISSGSDSIISIVAEKDCKAMMERNTASSRRQAHLNWSRQTPLSQKFNMKFELKTVENKPYRNNVLKWLEYTILTRLELGQEITQFDLNPDTFPSLIFSRVKRFNSRATKPLASH